LQFEVINNPYPISYFCNQPSQRFESINRLQTISLQPVGIWAFFLLENVLFSRFLFENDGILTEFYSDEKQTCTRPARGKNIFHQHEHMGNLLFNPCWNWEISCKLHI